jgi:ABC-type sugar transport system ATPase subunit
VTRHAQETLSADSGQNLYADEDAYWLYGLFYRNPNDRHLFKNSRIGMNASINLARPAGRVIMAVSVLLLLAMPFLGLWMMTEEFTPVRLSVDDAQLIVTHTSEVYEIDLDDIASAELTNTLPVLSKIVGTDLGPLLKGSFRAEGIGVCSVCLNTDEAVFLIIRTTETVYLLSVPTICRQRKSIRNYPDKSSSIRRFRHAPNQTSHKNVRDETRGGRSFAPHPPGRNLRIYRAQRSREDDDHQSRLRHSSVRQRRDSDRRPVSERPAPRVQAENRLYPGQSRSLWFLSGIRYLNFIADVYRVPAGERQESIRKYAELFQLTDDLAQPISSYSHGMKQKLAIISALIHDPQLMILDEPFVGLDPKASFTIKEIMREKCNRGGAVFFSTHVLEVAEKLCDKIAIIKNGKLIRSGDIEEVKGDASLESVFLELEGDI